MRIRISDEAQTRRIRERAVAIAQHNLKGIAIFVAIHHSQIRDMVSIKSATERWGTVPGIGKGKDHVRRNEPFPAPRNTVLG